MKEKNRKRKYLWITALAAVLLASCACGRKQESTEEQVTEPETVTAAKSTAAETGEEISSAVPSLESSIPETADPPEEDPWAEGYYFDEVLTAALWKQFATENTNDTEGSRLSPTMTRDFLEELNCRANAWLYEGVSDRETENAMLALSFRFPGDAPDTAHGLKSVRAGIYSFGGADPDGHAARIRLGNTEACFYLFLRAYYSEAEDRTRIYMINGLVW